MKIRTLMIPALFGVSVSQINLLINTMLASLLATGAISYLYYSDRLLEFPSASLRWAISTVILPALARKHVDADPADFSAHHGIGVHGDAARLASHGRHRHCASPYCRVLFMRGEFGLPRGEHVQCEPAGLHHGAAPDAHQGAGPGYYARQDTRTPVRIGIMAMVANMVQPHLHLSARLRGAGTPSPTACSRHPSCNAVLLLFKGLYQQDVYRPSCNSRAVLPQACLWRQRS